MADERLTPSGWLPPVAPGGAAPRRLDPPQPPPGQPAGPTFVQPSGAPTGRGSVPATWALVLTISALGLLVLSLGSLFFVTIPCSIAGWVLAVKARNRLERGATAAGEGQITAALWLARIGVLAGVAAGVALLLLIASGFDFEQLRDDVERELEQRRQREDGSGTGVRAALDGLRAASER